MFSETDSENNKSYSFCSSENNSPKNNNSRLIFDKSNIHNIIKPPKFNIMDDDHDTSMQGHIQTRSQTASDRAKMDRAFQSFLKVHPEMADKTGLVKHDEFDKVKEKFLIKPEVWIEDFRFSAIVQPKVIANCSRLELAYLLHRYMMIGAFCRNRLADLKTETDPAIKAFYDKLELDFETARASTYNTNVHLNPDPIDFNLAYALKQISALEQARSDWENACKSYENLYLCEASKYNDLSDEVVAEKAKVAQLQAEIDSYKNQDGLKDLDNWLFNIEMCFRKCNIPDDRRMIELGGNFLVGRSFDLHRKHITNGLYNWDEFKMGLIGLVPISLEKELLSEFRNLCVSSTMSFEKFCDRFNYITRKVEISDYRLKHKNT
jgi:hypothetical protein